MSMSISRTSTKVAVMALITALVFVLQFVTVPLGPITVSLSMVPVAIAAIAMEPEGGLMAGAIWGLASLMKAVMGTSGMTTMLLNMNAFKTILLCFIPRMLDGYLLGWLFRFMHKVIKLPTVVSGCVVGFFSALLNTIFFMSAIVLMFGHTEYIQNMMGGKNVIVFICSIIAGNAIFEMLTASVVTGPVAAALAKAGLISTRE